MNRDRLLADAKAKALELVAGYKPPKPPEFALPGPAGKTALGLAVDSFIRRGIATKHDVVVAGALADVLTGGEDRPDQDPVRAGHARSGARPVHAAGENP